MKIAITANAPDLDAAVDPRFGRCPYFLLVETDDLSFEALENPNAALGSGAGIQSAQLMAAQGVTRVLTGNCGPNAHMTLAAAHISVSVGCSGPIRDLIDRVKSGELDTAPGPNVPGHFGTGASFPQASTGGGGGMGRGMGRGMGKGMGRGMGKGMGRGKGGQGMMGVPFQPEGAPASKSDELALLKQQAEEMAAQARRIQERIGQLEQQAKPGTLVARVASAHCAGCGICLEACPVEAISMDAGVAVVDTDLCTGCGACLSTCPNGAIALN